MQENLCDLKLDKYFLYLSTNCKRKLDEMESMKFGAYVLQKTLLREEKRQVCRKGLTQEAKVAQTLHITRKSCLQDWSRFPGRLLEEQL